MPAIQLLDAHTANQIAAGEVVERPASVVKELVENALDAGASRIVVEVEDGGRKLIRVSDNGCGIPAEQLRLAFARHATSKLRTIDDLASLTTLGFRGEALPSIASVSRLSMVTRVASALGGASIAFAGGSLESQTDAAAPVGTTVAVRDLFYNTPAREKFLKSAASELARIVDVVSAQALAHPHTAFRLTSSGRELLATAGDGDLPAVVAAVLGNDVADCLRPLDYSADGLTIGGYAVSPQVSRSNRGGQFLFVNGRPIRSPLLGHALAEACRDLLPQGRHPLAVIFISVPPAEVDVNVHPAKAEVRFADERRAHAAVYAAVRAALSGGGLTGYGNAGQMQIAVAGGLTDRPRTDSNSRVGDSSRGEWSPRPAEQPFFSYLDRVRERPDAADHAPAGDLAAGGEPVRNSLAALVPLGQVRQTYIVAEGSDGLYVIDQHAAHERVLFERFLQPAATYSQALLIPLTIDLTPAELALIGELEQPLRELGFDLEPFGGGAIVIRSVPAGVAAEFGRATFTDLLAELAAGAEGNSPLSARDRIVAALAACKAAVKANDRLSVGAAASLLAQLGETANPWTCPHGRPTIIRFSHDELAKRFHRV
ncbi:MAG: DNA mismatch repair endonuclease MutL [Chloroflexota bacterium]